MTKKELIEAMAPYPDDAEILQVIGDDSRDNPVLDTVVSVAPGFATGFDGAEIEFERAEGGSTVNAILLFAVE